MIQKKNINNENKSLSNFSFCIKNDCVWIDISKSGSSTVLNHFKKIKNDSDFFIEGNLVVNWDLTVIKNNLDTFFKNKNKKLKLFFHIRDPWQKFLSAVGEDIKFLNKNYDQKFILNFCNSVEKNYSLGFDGSLGKCVSTDKVVKRLLMILKFFKDYVDDIEVWNFNFISLSLEKNWGSFPSDNANVSPLYLKQEIKKYFEFKEDFRRNFNKIMKLDYRLYEMIKDKQMEKITVKNFVKLFLK